MKAWEELLSTLELELGPQVVDQWLRPIKVVRFDAANLYLEATPFQQNWFEQQVRPKIASTFTNNNQRPIKIHWSALNNPQKPLQTEHEFQIAPNVIVKEYKLENFIVSKTNRMAFEMAKEIAQSGQSLFNPLFISGPPGCGKTHLLSSIANSLIEKGKKIFYVNAENFTEHVVQAIRLGRMLEFRRIYREIDGLIVDDIHLLARRNATQEEFFHTFNALHTQQRLIILASRASPSQLQDIEPRLISRFEWGITMQLEPPDTTALIKILAEKANLLSIKPSEGLLNFLIERFSSNPAASIEALHAIALRSPQQMDLKHIELILADLLEKESNQKTTCQTIIEQTALHFGIRPDDLTGSSQAKEFVLPRQIAMFLCRNILQTSFQGLGRIFDRDHSTVMTSVKQIKHAIENKDPKISSSIQTITQALCTT